MNPFTKSVSLIVAIAVGALVALMSVLSAADASRARERAGEALAKATPAATADHAHNGGTSTLESYARFAPQGSDIAKLASEHAPFPAELPPVPEGDVVPVELVLKDVDIEIAPGVKYKAWAWEGGAPGPVIHVRQGQTVKITLINDGAIPHSVDFHAARIAPNLAFRDVAPGESLSYTFQATDPGVFMYHCGTKPVLAHIANGMYGAIVVDPATPLPKADREYVLVSSEWYLESPGTDQPALYSAEKARARQPDWVTWNGYADQYVTHPLTADPGDVVRFYVMDAGPSLDVDFHVVGTILNRAYVNSDVSHWQSGVQTVSVPAGGGAIFDLKIDEPGLYPFVSHSFAAVDLGEVGLLKVGKVEGTMSH